MIVYAIRTAPVLRQPSLVTRNANDMTHTLPSLVSIVHPHKPRGILR